MDLQELRRQRVLRLLAELQSAGYTQQAIAQTLRLSPQYLSDVKQARRPATELLERRLADAFGQAYPWFLAEAGFASSQAAPADEARHGSIVLPMVLHPVRGDARHSQHWRGTLIELAGLPAVKARAATHPYILEVGVDDRGGRFRTGDQLLIDQAIDEHASPEAVQVVELSEGMFLARRNAQGGWHLARARASGRVERVTPIRVCGRVLGIVWSAFL